MALVRALNLLTCSPVDAIIPLTLQGTERKFNELS